MSTADEPVQLTPEDESAALRHREEVERARPKQEGEGVVAEGWSYIDDQVMVADVSHTSDEPAFVIAEIGFGWLPGTYPSVEAAREGHVAFVEEHGPLTPDA
jgi:hypothetical protein